MRGLLTDRVRAEHVLDAIGEIEKYLADVSFEEFLANSEKRFATIKQIEIIGEACNTYPPKPKKLIRKWDGNRSKPSVIFPYMNILI